LLMNMVSAALSSSKQAELMDRKITTRELEELKQVFGVGEKGRSYNQIINGYGTGLRPPTEDEWTKIASKIHVVDKILPNQISDPPAVVDHTTEPWFPPIGNQGSEGSCTTWAVGYYMKTFQEAKEHEWNLSDAEWIGGYFGYPTPEYQDRIFSPDFIYHQINDGGDHGSTFYDAINLVCNIGICSWEKMPYKPNDHTSWPSEEAWREAPFYRGNSSGFEYLKLSTNENLTNLKSWIASGNLAVIAVDANKYSSMTSEDLWTVDNYVDPIINHANTIVGYNDSMAYMEEGELRYGAFKIANSWGEGGWENIVDGCYWISYEAMKRRVVYAMFFRDRIDYEPKLLAAFKVDHPYRGECNTTFGIGNESAPIQTKQFDDFIYDGGNKPFCDNRIVFDITEFIDSVPTVINQSFFMEVYDVGGITTGVIQSFSIEYYSNYSAGTLYADSFSYEVPLNTESWDRVYARLTLKEELLTVNNAGPSDFHTIQEAINAANSGDTIGVYLGTYYENVVVNKTVLLIGENKEMTIVDGNKTGAVFHVIGINDAFVGRFTVRSGWPYGIYVNQSDIAKIKDNIVSNSLYGIQISGSEQANLTGNLVVNNTYGIQIFYSQGVILRNNTLIENTYNFRVWSYGGSPNGTIYDFIHDIDSSNMINGKPIYYLVNRQNELVPEDAGYVGIINSTNITVENLTLRENGQGILLAYTNDSNVNNVNLINNMDGICLLYSNNNSIYHNNFINNTQQALVHLSPNNIWNDSYPLGGNYWSDYSGADIYSGPYQNETGSDGIGDTPYIIAADNVDGYPLMKLWPPPDIAVLELTHSKQIVGQGYPVEIKISVKNQGNYSETFNLTIYANTTIIATFTNITLLSGNTTILAFTWNTTSAAKGNYTIKAYVVPIIGERELSDNTLVSYVFVACFCDVDANGKVEAKDIALIISAYGKTYKTPGWYEPDWYSNYDVDCNGKIEAIDIAYAIANYGRRE